MRSIWTKALTAGALAGLGAHAVSGADSTPTKPNVLFMVADDLNTSLGCYGAPVRTPHLDQLARAGTRFDRAYCQYPLCNPSRASFLSGRRPSGTHIYGNDIQPRQYMPGVPFLPEWFRSNGYYTARFGKIAHNPYENLVQWDEAHDAGWRLFIDMTAQEQWSLGGRKIFQMLASRPIDWAATDGDDFSEPDGRTASGAVEFLKAKREKPFFLALGWHLPHVPFVAPKKYFKDYPVEKVKLPKNPKEHFKDIPPIALAAQFQRKMTDKQSRESIAAYYACVTYVDAMAGLVLNELRAQGLSENTVIVFFSDHGFHLGEHGLWQKQSLFEESARVPMIICAPGKKNGQIVKRPVELVDLFPTLCDLCGIPKPDGLEGRSIVPLLDNPRLKWAEHADTEAARPGRDGLDLYDWYMSVNTAEKDGRIGRSIRTERYRYTEWDWGKSGAELYDHRDDPNEYRNLANDPAFAGLREKLKDILREAFGR